MKNTYKVFFRSRDDDEEVDDLLIAVKDGNLGDAYKAARDYLVKNRDEGYKIYAVEEYGLETPDLVIEGEYSKDE